LRALSFFLSFLHCIIISLSLTDFISRFSSSFTIFHFLCLLLSLFDDYYDALLIFIFDYADDYFHYFDFHDYADFHFHFLLMPLFFLIR